MNGWPLIVFAALMLVAATAQIALTVTGWAPPTPAIITQQDPSSGPNRWF